MSRQHDHLNQYYCPSVIRDGCAARMCIRRKEQPVGFVGPAVAYLECYDPESEATAAPTAWNPVYDAATPPPAERPAIDCAEVRRPSGAAHCGWIWGLIVLGLLGVLVFGGLAWAGKRHHDHAPPHGDRDRGMRPWLMSRDNDAVPNRTRCWPSRD
ncbi:hypothetical protein pmac_cds_177 [Pandoravirus macleodensis]|uniref:Transmembrane protein n=1 Tax=Pandoravirus macleodensis TaxID=2107707 RepID=A0A2U7UET3_9VIRU|nr:hypothetical protein pmac_cds_177 [Pandoravirus macleodensis]AVK76865.1 hypothetical protein pmac_cds_177 [Pandoravirus macleodensis]UMO79459.1 hypothetical protein [Pandoravirus aubagnensis]